MGSFARRATMLAKPTGREAVDTMKFSTSENTSALALCIPRRRDHLFIRSCRFDGSQSETKKLLELITGSSTSTALGS